LYDAETFVVGEVFVIEEMEGSEADVRKFFFAEREHHAGYEIRSLLKVARRNG
jgi:hypothetical protein